MFQHIRRAAVISLLGILPWATANAQDYPNREIKVICGFPAGSGADLTVRFFSEKLRPYAGQPLIIENKPGASSVIAAEYVARAKPDGYTIFITGGGPLTANPHVFKELRYDPSKDFQPIAPLLMQPFVLVVEPKAPHRSVADLLAFLKAKGDRASYAAPSVLSVANAEMFKAATGLPTVQVMYRTAMDALKDVQGGQIELYFADPLFAIEQVRSGRLRALAVTTPERVAPLPDLPTMAELGYPTVNVTSWWAIWAPTGIPDEVTQKMNGWANQLLATEDARKFLSSFGAVPWPGSPDVLKQQYLKEVETWKNVAQVVNLRQN